MSIRVALSYAMSTLSGKYDSYYSRSMCLAYGKVVTIDNRTIRFSTSDKKVRKKLPKNQYKLFDKVIFFSSKVIGINLFANGVLTGTNINSI